MQVEGQHGASLLALMATGGWVSNAYPTWPPLRDSPSKEGLIPDVPVSPHGVMGKGFGRKGMGMRSIRQPAG